MKTLQAAIPVLLLPSLSRADDWAQFQGPRGNGTSGEFLYRFTGQLGRESAMHASKCMMNLVCIEAATGKQRWSEPGIRQGIALTEADGLLFVRSYQTLRLVEVSPTGYRLLGEIKTHDNREPTLNLVDLVMPVLSGGKLYVRTCDELICYKVSAN